MTVYRIVWVMPSGDEIPDTVTYPSKCAAILSAFQIQAWAGVPYDFEVTPCRTSLNSMLTD